MMIILKEKTTTVNLNYCEDAWHENIEEKEKRINMMLEYILPFSDGPDLFKEYFALTSEEQLDRAINNKAFTSNDSMLFEYARECLLKTAEEIRDLSFKLSFMGNPPGETRFFGQAMSGEYDNEAVQRLAEYLSFLKIILIAYWYMEGEQAARDMLEFINEKMLEPYWGNIQITFNI